MQVERILRYLVYLHVFEPRRFQHFHCLFLPPHHSQTAAAVHQTHGHAVHQADGIQKRSHGVVQVAGQIGSGGDIDH